MRRDPRLAALLDEFKSGLSRIYGERLRGVYVFGSYARGGQEPDSDLDVLIVLDRIQGYGREVDCTGFMNARISLQFGVSVSRFFVAESDWRSADTPFLLNVREEAIPA